MVLAVTLLPVLPRKVGTLRIAMSGTRTVAMVSASDVVAHLDSKDTKDDSVEPADKSSSYHKVPGWLTTASVADFGNFCSEGYAVWIATQSAGDILYTPPGYAVTHNVMATGNTYGLRINVCSPMDEVAFKALRSCNQKAGKSTKILDQALLAIGFVE
jgi:hypothetical protein